MAVTITRTANTDDDGSGTTGTVFNNAWKTALYDQIDAALADVLPSAGGAMTGTDLYRTIATSSLRLSGGSGAGSGGNVVLFGESHATLPNTGQLNASLGWSVTGNFTHTSGFHQPSITAGITASTTQTQGQGALTTQRNVVATCANANDVVTLPAAVASREVEIFNNGAQTLQIFPAAGDNLGVGVDASATLTAGSNRRYVAIDATNWEIV